MLEADTGSGRDSAHGSRGLVSNHQLEETRECPHETDDAYMRADLTRLSTKPRGLVAAIAVSDYQAAKARLALIATIRTNGAGLMPELPR